MQKDNCDNQPAVAKLKARENERAKAINNEMGEPMGKHEAGLGSKTKKQQRQHDVTRPWAGGLASLHQGTSNKSVH